MRITVRTAEQLLDFNRVIGNPQRATDQLEGAVAVHNILHRHRIAYLADEVGMGKTYVALGVVALLRHFAPDLRLLVVAPRENIQRKWQRELGVFTEHNVRLDDLRVRMPGGVPVRPLVHCADLVELLEETAVGPDRDFFVRLPSFSLPLRRDEQQRHRFRDRLRRQIPWLPDDIVDLRANADVLKDRFAQAINAALPFFDLVIVDEAHNLKHGWGRQASARNQVLATVLGRDRDDVDPRLAPTYGSRAGKVLLLSATPVDDDYRQLWNQLDLFGRAGSFVSLRDPDASEERKREVAGQILIRRVTSLRVNGRRLTKNLYRREWRQGGVEKHDEPIEITDDRQRLTMALVQKKVTELLGHERFGARFQVGMLASFESFLQTSKATPEADEETTGDTTSHFDGDEQVSDAAERQGIDVPMLDQLARDHLQRFGRELPHPKMDALVNTLASSWRDGRKALVFVRRKASVSELKRKLDDEYNDWLIRRLRERIDRRHHALLDAAVEEFHQQRMQRVPAAANDGGHDSEEDVGGEDTFFAWYFRGRGPDGIISGARIQERFRNLGSGLGTFFDDNHVMALLGASPGQVADALAAALGEERDKSERLLREYSRHYLSSAKQPTRGARFDAAQAAALELLAEIPGTHQPRAEVIWRELYLPKKQGGAVAAEAEPNLLETTTFFTELRRRASLRAALWPAPASADLTAQVREQHVRAQLLSAAARLGHVFLDLYAVVTDHLPSLNPAQGTEPSDEIVTAWLDELQRQADTPPQTRGWSAYDELKSLADNHGLVLDTTLPELRRADLREASTLVGRLLTAQQPVAGMSGRVNRRLVQQFRLPGYPLVLICTDLLQEGEDLHTFCSRIYHYGLAWTPSAIEQRVGRIDRVRSETERRLTVPRDQVDGEDLLQVHYPHLADTIERLQARRVLHRMNDFLRLMHQGLALPAPGDSRLDVAREVHADGGMPPVPAELLTTSFPVRDEHLGGRDRPLAVDDSRVRRQLDRFAALSRGDLPGASIEWERGQRDPASLLGSTLLADGRKQPFSLQLEREGHALVVRCVSPIGRVERDEQWRELREWSASCQIRIGAVRARRGTYDITVEEDVLLTDRRSDHIRVAALIRRVTGLVDDVERPHLPERDRPLTDFRPELERVGRHAR